MCHVLEWYINTSNCFFLLLQTGKLTKLTEESVLNNRIPNVKVKIDTKTLLVHCPSTIRSEQEGTDK